MKDLKQHFQDNMFRELIIDCFAGGGGASTGIELALGQPVDIAINHDAMAIRMHEYNHPFTKHLQTSIHDVDPITVTECRQVGLAWFSPDCTHFSKAKGGKPRKKEIRDLAWIVVKWAKKVNPRIIMLENVEEFKTWGPLDEDGYPIKEKSGETFRKWCDELESLGYELQMKELRACDYGAPTTRKRLFIIARCDGMPIIWPQPTHGVGKGLLPYKTAADIIDWSLRGKSIFKRKKQLVDNTLRRVVRGIVKFVINNQNPYIMVNTTGHAPSSIDEPVDTITTGNHHYLTTPVISQLGHTGFKSDRNRSIEQSLSTIVSKAEHLLINPSIVPIGYGEAPGQKPRVNDSKEPLGTLVGTTKHHIAIPHIVKHFSGNGNKGSDIKEPLHTITSVDHNALCSAVMSSYYGTGDNVASVDEPVRTITAVEKHGLVKVIFKSMKDTNIGHWPQIRELLNKYGGYTLTEDQIIVFLIDDIEYIMIDIEMRMLIPKELYMAQGFPIDYNFDLGGKMTKTEQVKKVGNSVCPQVATALVKANFEIQNVPPMKTMAQLNHFITFGSLRKFRLKDV